MHRFTSLFVLALVPGCYQSYTDPLDRPDGGGVVSSDGGGPRVDATVPSVDGGSRRDAGRDTGIVDVCEGGERVDEYRGPRCADATRECIEGCERVGEPTECTDSCFFADPECVACYNQTLLSCGNDFGCQGAWDRFACCTARACPDVAPGSARLECAARGSCLDEIEAYATCIDGAIDPCQMLVSTCFSG